MYPTSDLDVFSAREIYPPQFGALTLFNTHGLMRRDFKYRLRRSSPLYLAVHAAAWLLGTASKRWPKPSDIELITSLRK